MSAIQYRQGSNAETDNIIPTCSTSAVHGERTMSQRPEAITKDSGISQVFFPPSFEGNSSVGSTL